MKNRSTRGKRLALWALAALGLAVASGCPARNTSDDREPNILSAIGDNPDGEPGQNRKQSAKTAAGQDPIFEHWPKPDLAILITGRQDGYVEPCGCAGLENQKGGLSRRHTLIKQLTAQGWHVVPVDVGGIVRRFGKQAELQFAMTADALKQMRYQGVGFGPNDLRLSAGDIASAVAPDGADTGKNANQSIFISANVSLFDKDSGVTSRYRVVEANGFKVGITSILGKTFQKEVNNSDIVFQPVDEAINEVLPELENCDLKILLSYASLEESSRLAKNYPKFDLVVTAEGKGEEPPDRPQLVEGTKNRRLIEVGNKAMYAAVVGIYGDVKKPMRYQRVPLDSRFGNSDDMKLLMQALQDNLKQLGWQGLGLKPAPHSQGQFAGSASCKECHKAAWDVWHASKHAQATETLVKDDPPRQFDAECVSCHVTGWNTTDFFPYKSGYLSVEETPKMLANGCENCHGPGASHVAAEEGQNKALQEQFRAVMHLPAQTKETNVCSKCHDHDNSPKFELEKYWSQIEH